MEKDKKRLYYVCEKHGDVTDYNRYFQYIHNTTTINIGDRTMKNLCSECLADFFRQFECKEEYRENDE